MTRQKLPLCECPEPDPVLVATVVGDILSGPSPYDFTQIVGTPMLSRSAIAGLWEQSTEREIPMKPSAVLNTVALAKLAKARDAAESVIAHITILQEGVREGCELPDSGVAAVERQCAQANRNVVAFAAYRDAALTAKHEEQRLAADPNLTALVAGLVEEFDGACPSNISSKLFEQLSRYAEASS